MSGEIYDVVIDLREDSETYKMSYCINLSGANKRQLYIPEGFAHAYLALEDSVICFKVTTNYISGDEIGFAWNSRLFNINWPIKNPTLNVSDERSPDYSLIFS